MVAAEEDEAGRRFDLQNGHSHERAQTPFAAVPIVSEEHTEKRVQRRLCESNKLLLIRVEDVDASGEEHAHHVGELAVEVAKHHEVALEIFQVSLFSSERRCCTLEECEEEFERE